MLIVTITDAARKLKWLRIFCPALPKMS